MSYDIILVRPRPGEDPLVAARHEGEEDMLENMPLDPEKEMLKRRVANALEKANPSLKRFVFDFGELAKIKNISVEQAQLMFRNIEINTPDDGNGIQIELYDDEACVTVPYWHDGVKAESTFQEIWEYLKVIQRESGFVAYDPQLDIILDLSNGYQESLKAYIAARNTIGKQMIPGMAPGGTQKTDKKWWQFWK